MFMKKPACSEYYWLNAPAISEQEPLMIGKYIGQGNRPNARWYIDGIFYAAGTGIDIISHIRKPKGY